MVSGNFPIPLVLNFKIGNFYEALPCASSPCVGNAALHSVSVQSFNACDKLCSIKSPQSSPYSLLSRSQKAALKKAELTVLAKALAGQLRFATMPQREAHEVGCRFCSHHRPVSTQKAVLGRNAVAGSFPGAGL